MSKAQRAAVKQLLGRLPRSSVEPPIEQMRAGFAAMMATLRVADGIATSAATLGARRAVVVAPAGEPAPGTILYFHGGSFSLGSPETAMSLTAALRSARACARATPGCRCPPPS